MTAPAYPVRDSAAVDSAIVARLLNDPALMALVPDGVYFTVAAQSAQRFIVIDVVSHREEKQFVDDDTPGGVAWEFFRYRIAAIALQSSGADVRAAALRVHELLTDPAALVADGYLISDCYRDGDYYRDVTIDPENASVRWQHRGGHYIVRAIPLP